MDGIHYRPPKAFRIHLEQLDKALRHDRERAAARARRQELLDRAAIARRQAEQLERQAAHLEDTTA